MRLYHLGTILKILVGIIILTSIYFTINPYEDPVIALSFGFLGVFIISWWLSFYVFYIVQYIATHKEKKKCAKDSYKLSLLFGMYVLANIALLLLWNWTKSIGIMLLIGFVLLQIFLTVTPEHDGRIDESP